MLFTFDNSVYIGINDIENKQALVMFFVGLGGHSRVISGNEGILAENRLGGILCHRGAGSFVRFGLDGEYARSTGFGVGRGGCCRKCGVGVDLVHQFAGALPKMWSDLRVL